jgi:hypothetical protein
MRKSKKKTASIRTPGQSESGKDTVIPRGPNLHDLSGIELIDALQGCLKGKGSLVEALDRNRRLDEEASERKRARFFGN